MLKHFMLVILALALCAGIASAQEMPDREAIWNFAFEQKLADFVDAYEIREWYQIILPEDASALNQQVREAYEKYESVYLLDCGYSRIPPILESMFVCVGILPDGTMEETLTPIHIVACTYDFNIMNGTEILRLEKE